MKRIRSALRALARPGAGLLAALVAATCLSGPVLAQENPDPTLQGVSRSQIQANGLPSSLVTSGRGVNQNGAPQIPRSGFDIINDGTVGTVLLRGVRLFPNPVDCNALQDDAIFLVTVAGRPGDADGDGAYSTNSGLCASRRNNNPANPKIIDGISAADAGILTFGENLRVRLDRNCDGKADLVFSLTNDPTQATQLRVESDDFTGHAGQVLGGRTVAWEAAVQPGTAYGQPCPDPATITGHYMLRIPNFSSYFVLPGMNATDFRFIVTAGSDDDGLEEDLIEGEVHKPEPRLSITKGPDLSLCPGATGNWTIHVSNDGNVKLTNLVVTDILPAGVTFQQVISGGVTASGTSTLTFSAFDLAQCASKDIVIQVKANDNCAGNGVNSASVTGVFQSLCDLTNPGVISEQQISAGPATANFTCLVKPCVTLTVNPLAPQCPNTPVTITGTAQNCGNGAGHLFVRIGNGPETDLGVVAAGASAPFSLPAGNLVCVEGGASYTINARASGDCPPDGTDSKNVSIVCLTPPCVTLTLNPLAPQCPNTPVTVTGTAQNCGSAAAHLFASLVGGQEVDLGVVAAGASVPVSLPAGNLVCVNGGATYNVHVRAVGDCPPEATDDKQVSITCLTLPCVQLTVNPLAPQCPNTPVTVTGSAKNCGTAAAHLFVSLAGGQDVDLGVVAAGASANFSLPAGNLVCVEGGASYTVNARAEGDCPPFATDSKNVSIVCLTPPCVQLTVDALAPQCPNTPVTVTGSAKNCGQAAAHLFVSLAGGQDVDLGVVAAGASAPFSLPAGNLVCVEGGASYTVNARAEGDCPPFATDSKNVSIVCLTAPCIQLTLNPLAPQCPGTPVTVAGSAKNCGSASGHFFVSLAGGQEVDLGVVAAGASVPFSLPAGNLVCVEGGASYTVNARAEGDCPPAATDSKNVTISCLVGSCIQLTLDKLPAQCPGTPVNVTGSAKNCGGVATHLFVKLGNGAEVDLGEVAAGGSVQFSLPAGNLVCTNGSATFTVNGRAASQCPPDGTDSKQVTVQCLTPPCVSLSLDALADRCEGELVTVTGKATNCGQAAAHLYVRLGDGAEVDLGMVKPGAGNAATFSFPVGALVCSNGQASYTVNARAVGECAPEATDSKSVSVRCNVPQIQIDKTAEAEVEPGNTIHYVITVTNPSKTADLTKVQVVDSQCPYVRNPVNFGGTCNVGAPQVNGTTITWPEFNLPRNSSCTLTFEVTAVGDGEPCVRDVTCRNDVHVTAYCGTRSVEGNASAETLIPCKRGLCRLTGGGCLNEKGDQKGHKQSTFGGNSSPEHTGGGPTGNSWEHVYRDGKTILFNWHSWDAHVIECSVVPPGPCSPKAVNTRADFVGTGKYSLGAGSREEDGNMVAYIIDHTEGACNKNVRDYYSIIVRKGLTIGSGDIVFQTEGEIDCGNLQIHETPARLFGNGVTAGNDLGDVALLNKVVPNPFSATTSFAFQVPEGSTAVEVGVYNVAGRLVKSLAAGTMAAGRQTVTWDGTDGSGIRMAPGVYFLKAVVGGKAETHRVIYLAR